MNGGGPLATMGLMDPFEAIRQALVDDKSNAAMTQLGWQPLFTGSAASKIVVVGQAPGRLAQASGVPWNDASGRRLVDWLGVSEQQFRDPDLFAMMPMDFYFPGSGRSGDLPPRKGFAERWHPPLLELMPGVRLTLLIGRYAQLHYLPARGTLTETVRDFRRYAPAQLPLVHPSPLNYGWHARNPWFVDEVVPELRTLVRTALDTP